MTFKFHATQPEQRASGAIAQLVERFHGMEEVLGSTPCGSTKFFLQTFLSKLQVSSRALDPRSRNLEYVSSIYDYFYFYWIAALRFACPRRQH